MHFRFSWIIQMLLMTFMLIDKMLNELAINTICCIYLSEVHSPKN